MRSLREIQNDIASLALALAALEKERDEARAVRQLGIVADFDAGLARTAIAEKWDVDYGYVAGVLHKARRTERTRRARDLTLAQRAHYEIALRGGASSALARRIAEAVA
ncbi:hypothetical protein [Reyranella sp.]|uniref:hypothetical protein n=1 Tax=Reyranella sp. TaxID=1929291 RepID=UPI003D109934